MELLNFQIKENKFKRLSDVDSSYIEYIQSFAQNSAYYPRFHIAPPHGLMNDPNGLIQLNGWYHIFYQWFPLGPVHGLKYWYHMKTRDFIEYIDMGPAMFPDTELDQNGCFTGMSVIEDSQWVIYYTGVDKNELQQVCRAAFDGRKFVKKQLCIPHNPSITTHHFRDPYLYKNQYLLVGAQTPDNAGHIALYEKKQNEFIFNGFLDIPEDLSGYMLECPNLVPLNEDMDLLVFSPQGIRSPDRYTYRNIFSVVYAIGKFDFQNRKFYCEKFEEIDKGFDFYAPQIFRDESGRTILMGWLGNSECIYPSDFEQWAHMMTIPREISWEGDQLRQLPVSELKALRQAPISLNSSTVLTERYFELEFTAGTNFLLKLRNKIGNQLVFGGSEREYFLDRGNTSHVYNESYGTIRYAVRNLQESQLLHVYIDRSTIEIFAENGSVVLTSRFYLDDPWELCCENIFGVMYYLDPVRILSANGITFDQENCEKP